MQGCMICPTPTNHVRNLDEELNIDESNSTPSTLADLPQPPPDHLISMFTRRLNTVIQQNNVELLKSTIKLLQKPIESNLDFCVYDCSAFDAACRTASEILAFHASMSSIVPDLPSLSPQHNLQPHASFKPPKLDTPTWSGKSGDFYPWLSTILNGFKLTQAGDVVKVALTLQAFPFYQTRTLQQHHGLDHFQDQAN